MDIGSWLKGLGLGQYETTFRDNEINEKILLSLTAEDLKDLGVALVGHRRRLLDAIAALQAEPIAKTPPASAADHKKGTAERRQVTVMFADLVGSTALAAGMDPEDLREVVAAYHRCAGEAVRRVGGFVSQYLGDGVLVYFGYPQAHEDDPERAVRASLDLIAAVAALTTRATLQTRVGIATGLVVVGDVVDAGGSQERGIIGETPNLAARLQGFAQPNTVVIAESTRRLLGDLFELQELGARELKGIAGPVRAWLVLRARSVESRFEALHTSGMSALVGREEETQMLLRRWEHAKAGEGQVVLLAGEAGIGKSRITENLLVRLKHEPLTRLRYFCSPHHIHSALYPIITQLERAANFEPGRDPAVNLNKLEALLKPTTQNVPQDLALIAELLAVPVNARYPVLEVSPQHKREMTLTALLNQLESTAALGPVLIVFEDAHWIDPTSHDLLDRIVARVADLPVLLVITFRLEFQPTWVGLPHVTMLVLNRLGRRDAASIISGITHGKALPEAVTQQILVRTDGVPLFIEELTSALLESRLMRETPDRYVHEGQLPPLAIPPTLQASLVARLDRLPSARGVAQIGAAIGREFSHELIAAVAPLAPVDLDAALERLTESGLISRRGTPPHAIYSFKHALVQDAAYSTLLKSRRQELHAAIANALMGRFESLPEVVAHHLTEAGLANEAIGYWRKAGQLAGGRSANREAAKFFEQALAVLKGLPESPFTLEQGFEIRLELRPMLAVVGEFRRALERLREAESIAERLDDDRLRGRVCAFATNAHALLGEFDQALASGTRALDIAERLEDPRLRIITTTYVEQTHYYRGEYDHVVELASTGLAALPSDRVYENFGNAAPASVYGRAWLIMSLAELGRFEEAVEPLAEMLRIAEPLHHAFTAGTAYWAANTLHFVKGDWTQAHLETEKWISVVRTGNVLLLLPLAVAFSAWALAQLGETIEVLHRLSEGEELLERLAATGVIGVLGWNYHALGRARLLLDQLDEARRLAERSLETSTGHAGFAAHAFHLLGDIAAHPDRLDADSGSAHYRNALALAEPRGMRPLVAHCHFGLGRLYGRTRKREEAREHLTIAAKMYREMDMSFWLEEANLDTPYVR
jgi:class 3 adenylate cyclase/tetratricopeptide (TPR) repeat protein